MDEQEQDTSSLIKRLETAERGIRQLRFRGIAAIIVLLVLPMILDRAFPETRSRVVRAFIVKDGSGNERAALGVNQKGWPVLQLRDKQGKARAVLGLNEGGRPSLNFEDEQGRVRLQVDEAMDGTVRMAFFVPAGNGFVSITQKADGTPRLEAGKDGTLLWSAP